MGSIYAIGGHQLAQKPGTLMSP